jgi:hypothetical protein
MNRIAVISLLALSPSLASADSVFLKNGGEIKGEIVEQRADVVVLEVGPGRISVPMKNVARIVSSTTDLGLYHARAAALAPRDVAGWLSLAAWAQRHDLATQAREAYEHVLAMDPMNADAQLALGNVRMGDRWVSEATANRARGLVQFEGRWTTPEDRELALRERAADAEQRMVAREADARAREAEARAREATARAEAAEADARQARADQASSGIPLNGVYGGYGPVVPGPYNPFPVVLPPRPRSGMGHGHRPPGTRLDPPAVRVDPPTVRPEPPANPPRPPRSDNGGLGVAPDKPGH